MKPLQMRFCWTFILIVRVGEGSNSPFSSLTEHFRLAFPPSLWARPHDGPFINFSPGIRTTPAFFPAQSFSFEAHCNDHEPASGFEVNCPAVGFGFVEPGGEAGLWNTFPGVQCCLRCFFSVNSFKSADNSSKTISCMRLLVICIFVLNLKNFQRQIQRPKYAIGERIFL